MAYLHPPGESFREASHKFYRLHERENITWTLKCARYDKDLTYLLLPNHRCINETHEYKIVVDSNSAGLRDDQQSLGHPSTIFLGDSHLFG